MILVEAVSDSSSEDACCESDKEPSCDEEDESRRQLKTQYVHPKRKDKGGMYLYIACVIIIPYSGKFSRVLIFAVSWIRVNPQNFIP